MTKEQLNPVHVVSSSSEIRCTTQARSRRQFLALGAALTAVAALFASPPAFADFGIASWDGDVLNADGSASTQAGAHPFEASFRFDLNRTGDLPDGDLKDIDVDLPPGFIGDPSVGPKCGSVEELRVATCPDSTQVGVAAVEFGNGGGTVFAPVYNLAAPPGAPARFGFSAQLLVVLLDAYVRSDGDYGVSVRVNNVSQQIPVLGTNVTLWGVPADPSHDDERGWNGDKSLPCASPAPTADCSHPAGVEPKPFLTNPTSCTPPGVGLPFHLQVNSWQTPGVFDEATFVSHQPPPNESTPAGTTGCEHVPFDPEIEVEPHESKPDAPSGYTVELRIPESEDENALAQAHLKRAVVNLPEGVTLNPSAADGLEGCSDAQVGLRSASPPACPERSKIGTATVETPLLEDPLSGNVYVGSQLPNDRYRIFIVLEGPGVVIKLKGSVQPDPMTGQLTTVFDNNPQLPFDVLRIEFKGGSRAPLANPPTCGTKTVTTSLEPWSGNPAATPGDTFTIDCPGVSGFAPAFAAGSMLPTGGRFSPFGVRIDRPDGQAYLAGVSVEMPPGVLAKLRDVPRCPDAQANAGTCGVETRVGTATVGAGAGTDPFFIRGSVSLTGPYKGAPFGLAVSVRAIAGPYDLGTVVVRQAIHIDPVDAHVTVVSDPLPTILEGIPLRLRSINVDIDRPGFMLNPTSCGQKQIKATLTSTAGSTYQTSQRFQIGDCQALPLRPRLAMRLTGRRQTKDGGHPGLRAVLTQPANQANLKRVAVKLPLSLALDPDNARSLCEFEDGLRVACPEGSIIGRARAFTPLLNEPLTGPVYFVKGVRFDPRTGSRIRTLPTLLLPLRGEGVAVDIRATSSVRRSRLITTFGTIPDAPVSRFELSLDGGRNGILVVTSNQNLCRGRQVAGREVDGHNGRRADGAIRIKTPCKASTKKRRARRR